MLSSALNKNTLPCQTRAVRMHSRVPTSTRTEFHRLTHDTNTPRCKMAVTQSTCNMGSKCKIVYCMEKGCF